MSMQTALGLLIFLVVYHHVFYPLMLPHLARRFGTAPRSHPDQIVHELPTVTVIVPVYNEADVIACKLQNLAALDYEPNKLKVIVACDGCTDATEEQARDAIGSLPQPGPHFIISARPTNGGKIAVVNDEVCRVTSEMVVLTDASAKVNAGALKIAARHFLDPRVGVVCGTYLLSEDSSPAERAYWRYQINIKMAEAALASPIGAHGAFYVFRRSLWTPMDASTINDDVILPMAIVADGYRAIYENRIVARELELTSSKHEFNRRIRIGAGNWQQAIRLWQLANPNRGWLAFVFVSGKFLRGLMPAVLASVAGLTAILAFSGSTFYQIGLAAMVATTALAFSLPSENRVAYIFWGYVAAGLGSMLLFSGRGSRVWRLSLDGKQDKKYS